TIGIDAIRAGLEAAKSDDKIKGIYIDISGISAGMATLEEIRVALIDFKKSNKFVVAYSEFYSQGSYYLASVADEMYIYPEGNMDFRGLGTEVMFFKNMLDKLEIEMQIIRGSNNKFKSAVEPFMYDHMSDANRAQMETLIGSMWEHMKSGIEKSRGITMAELDAIADSAAVSTAADAVSFKMVDGAKYKDEMIALLQTKMGVEKIADLNVVEFATYAKKEMKKVRKKGASNGNIAIVYANGAIESGEGNLETIGSEGVSKALRAARLNDDVKAIVLRVNSPGGSALASDVIWREVKLIEETDKPIIVTMGDYAASGGYYIACAADKIYAQPNTLTGSIGVFGVIPNLQGLLNNKLGITTDRVETNEFALLSMTKPLEEAEIKLIQEGVDEVYGLFKQRVADGRDGLDVAGVDSIGQGRVWSGADAIAIGLVDELGGIEDAIAYAAAEAGIETDDIKIIEYPKMAGDDLSELLEILESFDQNADDDNDPGLSEEIMKNLIAIDKMTKMKGIQARIPFELVIK
ncbi:MAG: protease-4, partial [Parvicellaceae bacterium]